MALSCWGFVPEHLDLRFPSLMPASPREEAEIREQNARTVIQAVQAGLLTPGEGRERLLEIL